MNAVTLRGVTKTYTGRRGEPDRVAVRPLDLTLEEGEFLGLLGPNGCGKSTLLKVLVGIESPSSGEISPAADRDFRAGLGVVFQSPALDPILTVRENLRLAGTLYGMSSKESADRIASLADELGVGDRLDSRVNTLSGGLARRADLVRALLPEPSLLVIDEATSSLDQSAREEFIRLIHTQRSQRSITIVMATHRPEELEGADRVLLMSLGRIVDEGSPAHLRAALGTTELTVFDPDPVAATTLRDSGFTPIECGRDLIVFADRFEPSLISKLHESNSSLLIRPTDLAGVYRHRLGQEEGERA